MWGYTNTKICLLADIVYFFRATFTVITCQKVKVKSWPGSIEIWYVLNDFGHFLETINSLSFELEMKLVYCKTVLDIQFDWPWWPWWPWKNQGYWPTCIKLIWVYEQRVGIPLYFLNSYSWNFVICFVTCWKWLDLDFFKVMSRAKPENFRIFISRTCLLDIFRAVNRSFLVILIHQEVGTVLPLDHHFHVIIVTLLFYLWHICDTDL